MSNDDGYVSAHDEFAALSMAEVVKLSEAGYRPVLRWERSTPGCRVICSTGEAMKNIEIAAKEKACGESPAGHVRGGAWDSCRRCGATMPWGKTK